MYKITLAQAVFRNEDFSSNHTKMESMVKESKQHHPDTRLIVFPELSATGYFLSPRLKELAQEKEGVIFQKMREIAYQYDIWIVYGYVEKDLKGNIYNAIQMVDPEGNLAANYRKIHLTPLEKELFTPGSELVTVKTELGIIGLMICWDLAFPELSRTLALKGTDLLVAPSAWEVPYDTPFKLFGAARAIDNTVFVAACNHVGTSEELSFFGKSSIYGPDGKIIASSSNGQEDLIVADIEYDWRNELKTTFYNMLKERRIDLY